MAATSTTAASVPLSGEAPVGRSRFDEWKFDEAVRALESLKINDFPNQFRIASDYAIKHDFFRNGDEWIGPGVPSEKPTIEKQFAPDDVIGEALHNVTNAFNEPQVGFVPIVEIGEGQQMPEALRVRIQEAESWFFDWWDRVRMQERIHDLLFDSAWAGKACLRPWIPARFLLRSGNSARVVKATTVQEALRYIYLSSPNPEVCGIYTDPVTQQRCAIFLGETEDVVDDKAKMVRWVELTYLDPDATTDEEADTVIRVIYENEDRGDYEARFAIGGRLLTAGIEARSLVTMPVVRAQRQLNLMWSIISHMTISAGFRERYITNAKPQGARTPYKAGDTVPEGKFVESDSGNVKWLVTPEERTLGANSTTEPVGLPTFTAGQITGHETPGITVIDPVDPTPYIEAAMATRGRILRMCNQGHLTNTSAAEASGFAYEQARAAFEKDLLRRRVPEEGALRDLIMGVLALAERLSEQDGYFTDILRVTVDQHIDPGPRAPEAVRTDIEANEHGLLSDETTMSRLRVEDTEAERARLLSSPKYLLDILLKATETGEMFTGDGIIRTLRKMGVPGALLDELEAQDLDDLAPQQQGAGGGGEET